MIFVKIFLTIILTNVKLLIENLTIVKIRRNMITIDNIRRICDQAVIRYAHKFTIPLPDTFIEDNSIQIKEELEIYRERVNGRDALILIPKIKPVQDELNSEQSSPRNIQLEYQQ